MHAVALVFRGELRRRWRSWVALAILLTLAGGTVLAALAAGWRTSSAFPSFVKRYGYDAAVFSVRPLHAPASLPGVAAAVTVQGYAIGNLRIGNRILPAADTAVFSEPDSSFRKLSRLVEGRLPAPSSATEAVVSFNLAQQYHLRVGSSLRVRCYSASQGAAAETNQTTVPPRGPALHLLVVGIEASVDDFQQASYSLIVGPAFARREAPRLFDEYAAFVRLRDGAAGLSQFTAEVTRADRGVAFISNGDAGDGEIEGSIHPQAVGWWLLAILDGVAALAIVAQAFARQALVQSESYPALKALGLTPVQLFGLGVASSATAAAAGAVGAVALGFALSPLTPVGVARDATVSQGFFFDSVVLLGGGCGVLLIALAVAAVPSWRVSRAFAGRTPRLGANIAATPATQGWRAGAAGLPTALVGTRRALDRGRGRSRLPVGTALLGTSLAVTALVATAVFGASLTHLTNTPRLYGRPWQLELSGGMTGSQVHTIIPVVARTPGVAQIASGYAGGYLKTDGVTVQVILATVERGPEPFSMVTGHFPTDQDEIVLGTSTMRQIGAHLGSTIRVSVPSQSGSATVPFTVVGTTAFEPNLNTGGLGDGAVVLAAGGLRAYCGGGSEAANCRRSAALRLEQASGWGILISGTPGRTGRTAIASLARRFVALETLPETPANLVSFGQAVNFPLLLGIILALLGAAMFAHLLVVSVARRRRDVALLKTLGFVRRQVAGAVCWQASTIALVAVTCGVPLGIAVGRLVWRTFASNLGAVPVVVVPGSLIVVLAAGVLVAANVLAGIPAITASRLRAAEALRQA